MRSAPPLCDQRQGHYLPGTRAPLPAPTHLAGGRGISPFILPTLLITGSDIDEEIPQFLNFYFFKQTCMIATHSPSFSLRIPGLMVDKE